jgi:hypothetical protein
MYYCILILTAVAILHFVYESIIAPTFRLKSRPKIDSLSGVSSERFCNFLHRGMLSR